MKGSFPKRDKRQSKNRICNAKVKFGDYVSAKSSSEMALVLFWKRTLQMVFMPSLHYLTSYICWVSKLEILEEGDRLANLIGRSNCNCMEFTINHV